MLLPRLDFVENRRETTGSLLSHIVKKPSPLAALDCVQDRLLQRPAAPPDLL